MNKYLYDNYGDFITTLYDEETIKLNENENFVRWVTFQVTDKCNLQCKYCYQTNKGNRFMTKETAKKIVDLLFKMYEDDNNYFINKRTKGLIIDFIGGEELLNIEVIEFVCKYFLERCLKEHHPWLYCSRFCMISNGTLYFNEDFQNFIKKYKDFFSFEITLDGPKEIHDKCRVFPDGTGSYDLASAAENDYHNNICKNDNNGTTKVTIAPENLKDINKIIKFFIEEKNKKTIHANCVFEAEWTIEQGKIFYEELKKMADYLLDKNIPDLNVSLFSEVCGRPRDEDDIQCFCGGSGKMLAFDPDGIAYPCLRFMESSLGKDIPPVIIGDCNNGLFYTEEMKKNKELLLSITRRTKETDECFYCPIQMGCADCEAWNYQSAGGKFNIKSTNICITHKARTLANVYYWNKFYKRNNINQKFKMYLPKEECLKIIPEEEYEMLLALSE